MTDLSQLLVRIREGRVALPDFQRDYDWTETDSTALLVTVLSGWPAGSLLLMRGKGSFLKLRPIEGAPLDSIRVDWVVLDGQQRLTSLYQAFYNAGPTVYAINYAGLDQTGGELEDAIQYFERSEWEGRYGSLTAQADANLLPCYALLSPSSFFEWRDETVRLLPQGKAEEFRERVTKVYRDVLSVVHRYDFPCVFLDENVPAAAVARIFERVNRHGTALGTFDLMVAKVYEPHWNLRERWDRARQAVPRLEVFLREDGMPVLQAIALRSLGDLRQAAVLRLRKETVHDSWDVCVRAMQTALSFLDQQCGVQTPELLPYRGMLIPLAAMAAERPIEEWGRAAERWFWNSSFGEAFDAAANTRLVTAYADLKHAMLGQSLSSHAVVDAESVRSASRKSSKAIWAAFQCALVANLRNGVLEDGRRAVGEDPLLTPGEANLGVVSIYPKAPGIPAPVEGAPPHLRVLSLVAMPPALAVEVRRSGLIRTLRRAKQGAGKSLSELLALNFLPPLDVIEELQASPEDLFEYRLRGLAVFLERRAGVRLTRSSGEAMPAGDMSQGQE